MSNLAAPVADHGIFLHKTGKIVLIMALLCMAFFMIKPVTFKSFAYRVFREIAKYNIMWRTRGWNEIESAGFIVRYRDQDSSVSRLVLNTAEKHHEPVSDNFGYKAGSKMLIVIYPSRESLSRSFGWAADESAMGVYWAGVIRVLSPSAWVYADSSEELETVFEIQGPVAHEMTHLMVDYMTHGNYTRWFTEGISQYVEVKVTGYRAEDLLIEHPDELYPFDRMDRGFDNLPDQGMAYFQSLQAVSYLANKYGEDSIRKVLDKLGQGFTMDASFKAVLGISMDGFENEFKTWVVSGRDVL